jgi:hypothetical protein
VNIKNSNPAKEIHLPFKRGPLFWLFCGVRVARVIVFTVAVLAVVLALHVRSVRASAAEQAVVLGKELAQFGDLMSGAHRVQINGENIYVSTALSTQSVQSVLDRFQRYCDARNGSVPQDFATQAPEKADELRQALGDDWLDHWGVVRDGDDTEGTVMCIAQRDQAGVAGIVRKLQSFMKSWDLGDVGDFRYVYAKRVDGGRTHVITSLTDGPFHLRNILGQDGGDAPGDDPPATPRPPQSRRILSSVVDGLPYGVQMFATNKPVEDVLSFYDHELPARGWERITANRVLGAQAWRMRGTTMLVNAARVEGDEGTKVTFAEGRQGPGFEESLGTP